MRSVCSVHSVSALKRDGGVVEGRVITHWRFAGGRIARCKVLTQMTTISPEDRDPGSRS